MDNIKKKIGIYSPYLNIFGGGERYILSIAELLAKDNYVYLFEEYKLKQKVRDYFDISLDKVNFVSNGLFLTKNIINKYISLKKMDYFFYMTDGSLFFSPAKKNYLIIQSPSHIPPLTKLNRIKLVNWDCICYSQFMKDIILKKLKKKAIILPPPVATNKFISKLSKKKNIILTVGRFFRHLHDKKQQFLLDVFIDNHKTLFKNWKLVIAGGLTENKESSYVEDLKIKSKGCPVSILVNPKFEDLVSIYSESKIYWHATGYGEDIDRYPERAEHFGITTLEAMSGECVPVVISMGGQKELVTEGINGYLWSTKDDLVSKTSLLINNPELLKDLSPLARKRALDFSYDVFYGKLKKIIEN